MIFTMGGVRYFVTFSYTLNRFDVWQMSDSLYDAFFNRSPRRD